MFPSLCNNASHANIGAGYQEDVQYKNVTRQTTGGSRRQVKNVSNFVKNVKIVEFHDNIWNHHNKCIQISTNMPGIGSLIREIAVQISDM